MSSADAKGGQRIFVLDAVRGFAVLGILLMNVVDFAMPGYAYYDPSYYGGDQGINFASWAANYILFDGKMRGLFTMMFGASMVLVIERAERSGDSGARVHLWRMVWLLVFGMIHLWLIWYGDILVLYSLAGMVALLFWRWSPKRLFVLAGVLLAIKLGLGVAHYVEVQQIQAAAAAPMATAGDRARWAQVQEENVLPSVESQLKGYRGSYVDALEARIPLALYILFDAHPHAMPDTIALIAIGMALFRLGFFSGTWSRRSYRRIALWSFLICVPLYWPLVLWNVRDGYALTTLHATEAIHLTLLRPAMCMGYAALVILFMTRGGASALGDRLAAAGRMAFSNYIGSSILCTLFFNGYGLGWYGILERWQCYFVVFAIWALILLWSKPWLDHFHYGPLEWLWRSLTRRELQPFKRRETRHAH